MNTILEYKEFILLFFLTTISALFGNMKNILLIKGSTRDKYIFNGLDALIFGMLFKSMASDNSILGVLVYVSGRLTAISLTELIVNKIYKVVYLINLFIEEDDYPKLESYLLENNISFTRYMGNFLDKQRFHLSIHIAKSDYSKFINDITFNLGIVNPTMDVSEVKVHGKIKERTLLS